MLHRTSENDIRELFDDRVYEKGVDLFRAWKVISVSIHNSRLNAYVLGSANKPYQVIINFDEMGFVDECRCTCMYSVFCKHGVAALLKANVMMPRRNEVHLPPPEELAALINSKPEFKPVTLEPMSPRRSQLSLSLELFVDRKKYTADPKKRYALEFTAGADTYERQLLITPALRYIKLDGTHGRIEKYNSEKITETPSPEARYLASIIGGYPPNYFTDWIRYIYDNNINVVLQIPGFAEKNAVILNIEKVKISFVFDYLTADERSVNYRTAFSFSRNNGKVWSEPVSEFRVEYSPAMTVIIDRECNVWVSVDHIFNKFLHDVLRIKKWDDREISDLNIIVRERFPDRVEIIFQPLRPVIVESVPKPVAMIADSLNGRVTASLFFRYGGRHLITAASNMNARHLFDNPPALGGTVDVYKRNLEVEELFILELKRIIPRGALNPEQFKDRLALIQHLLGNYGRALLDSGFEISLENLEGGSVRLSNGPLRIKSDTRIDWFNFAVGFYEEDFFNPFNIDERLLAMGVVKINDDFVFLSESDKNKLNNLIEYGVIVDGKVRVSCADLAFISENYKLFVKDMPAAFTRLYEAAMKLTDFKGVNEYSLPENFHCELRDYQLAGYNWLRFLHESGFNGCLADDMGLGKTVQTLCLLQSLKELKLLKTSMVVAPVSTIPNWEREAQRFCPELKIVKLIGFGREKNTAHLQEYDLIITSYQTLSRDVEMVSGMELTYLILDESQVVKNSRTIAYRAVSVLKCGHRLALSGTPVENSSFELWSLMNFLNPGLLGSEKEFRKKFALPIEKHENFGAANLLRRKIHPFILRRKKGEVAKELPPRTEIVRFVEMEGNQAKAYDIIRQRCMGLLHDVISTKGIANSSMEILAAITRLRQASLFPVLADRAFEKVPSCKFLELKEMIADILSEGDNKIIIFSQFVKVLSFIKAHCQGAGHKFSYIDGSVKNRDEEIQRFQNDPEVRIFLISLKAGGFGINLTAADYVILFDPWWNPAVESQAIDRAHRIGRTGEVIAYRLIAKGTIEEKMLIIQEKKKALFDQLIAEDASFVKKLTQEDLMDLFS